MATLAGMRRAARTFNQQRSVYRDNRVAWAHDCIQWRTGEGLTDYQDEILAALDTHGRVAVVAPHGVGKSTVGALAVLHFATTRDIERIDWKTPVTASVWHQLKRYFWPEVHKWAPRIDWTKVGRPAFTRDELLKLSLTLSTGSAFAVTSDNPANIEGAHADSLFYLLDEAKTIPPETWDAIEGAFAGAGPSTGIEAFALATSTPGEPSGRFYDIHQKRAGLGNWHTIHVTLDDAAAGGRIDRTWAEEKAQLWGVRSPQYRNRVLGEFAEQERDTVIPLRWIELAQERWLALHDDAGAWLPDALPHITNVGVDVARSGDNKTVLAFRHANVIRELARYEKLVTTETADIVEPHIALAGVWATVDTDGVGAGVTDQLRKKGREVWPFRAAAKTNWRDRSGLLEFGNTRAAAWFNLREMLDPDLGEDLALPPDDELLADLVAPKAREGVAGRIFVTRKEDLERDLGRSPDAGDAVVMACWPERPPVIGLPSGRRPAPSGLTDDLMGRRW